MTDRESITQEVERACIIAGKSYVETEHSLTVIGGPKFTWTAEGEIKSIIRGGQSYGPDGGRKMR